MSSFVRELGKERFVGATELQRCLVWGESPICLTLAPGPTSGSQKGEDMEALVWPSASGALSQNEG